MNDSDYNKLKGAYRAGYDKGFSDGCESLKVEGWKTISDYADVKEGDLVKFLVATCCSFKGLARVTFVDTHGIIALPLGEQDELATVECCFHECLVKK